MKQNIKDLRNILRPHLVKSCFAEFLRGGSTVPAALLTAEVVARAADAAKNGEVRRVLALGVTLAAVLALSETLSALLSAWAVQTSEKGGNAVRQKMYSAFLSRPLWELNAEEHGSAKEKLNDDLLSACGFYSSLLPRVTVALFSAALYLVWILLRAPWLGLVFFAMVPVFVVSAAIMKNSFKNAYGDCRDIEAELTDYVVSSYDGFTDIRLYGLVDRWISGVKEIHRRYIRIGNRAEFLSGLQDSATTTVSAVLKYGAFAVAGAFVLWGDLELGAALASATLAGKFFAAAGSAAELLPRFSQAEKAMERLSVWVSPFFEENADVPALENASVDGVLSNLTLKADLNGIIRIKGENGSGKTTLIKLLAGMIKPDRGGCKSISAEKIAYLSQHEPEFGVSGNELLSCVSGAEKIAAEFGLSSEILASGVDELSGGERKKVFLSLVFARDPELIILDEPTNSLDESGIRVLRELIKNRGRGVLFVCHGSALDGLATCELTVKNGEVCAE